MSVPISKVSLTLAREARRVTQTELAEAVQVAQGTISKIENGIITTVEDAVLAKIALKLRYPVEFFIEAIEDLPLPAVFYRRRGKLKASDERAIRAQVNIARRSIMRLLQAVEIPDGCIPKISLPESNLQPSQVARELRAQWGIPSGPIASVTELLERAGVIIVPTSFDVPNVDAVSATGHGCPPLVFISDSVPGDVMRFTLAFELAHIIFHHHQLIPDESLEIDAGAFAGEFLAPATELRPYLTNLSIDKLASLKRHWRLSMACLLKRASDTGRLTEWKSRKLWSEVSRLGYRTREPIPIEQEKVSLFPGLIRVHIEDLGYTPEELNRAMVGDLSAFVREKPMLRAVK